MVERDARALFLGQQVVRDVVAVHRVLGLAGGDEDVLGAGDLVGDGVNLLLELREGLGEDALILDGEVVQAVHQAARCHAGVSSRSWFAYGFCPRRPDQPELAASLGGGPPKTRVSIGWGGAGEHGITIPPNSPF